MTGVAYREDPNWWVKVTREILKEIDQSKLTALSKISTLRSWFSILSEWAMIVAMFWAAAYFNHPLVYILAVFFMAGRMHALGIIMHEGVHYILFKNKFFNDFAATVLCGWPVFLHMHAFRYAHLPHHKYLNTTQDPDLIMLSVRGEYKFPKTRKELKSLFIRDLCGITTLNAIWSKLKFEYLKIFKMGGLKKLGQDQVNSPKGYVWGQRIFYLTVIPLVIFFIGWKLFLLCWILPYFTWRPFIFRLRIIAEHYSLPEEPILLDTRNVIPNVLEDLFIVPRNLNYHLVHHLFPAVPQYNLPRLHKMLMNNSKVYKDGAHNLSSYVQVLREVFSMTKLEFAD